MLAKEPDALSLPDDEMHETFRAIGVDLMFTHIKQSLHDFGTDFDVYTHEDSMHTSGRVDQAIARLREVGNIYEKDGATWLRTTDFGDDKDRVVIKSDGNPAYVAADIAYYLDKRERGFDLCIYMLGADHHGYIARLKAIAVRARRGPRHRRGADRPDGQPGPRRPAGADEQAGRHGHHARRPGRGDRRRRRPVRADPVVGGHPDRHRSGAVVVGVQRKPGLLRAIRARAALGAGAQRRRARPHRRTPSHLELLTHEKEGTLIRNIGEFPRVLKTAASLREPHRVSPLPGGPRRRLPPVLRLLPGAAAGRRGAHRAAHRAAGAVPGHPPGHRERPGDPRRHRTGADVNAHPAGPRHAEEIHHAGAPAAPAVAGPSC